jgi:hypothetical protein
MLAWSGPGFGPAMRAAMFTASLDRDTVTLGESATLSLTFSDGTPQAVPSPPQIPNLRISYLGPSSQFSFINGQTTSTVTHNFQVTPQQAGNFTIPALTAQVGSERLTSQPLQLVALKPTATPPTAAASGTAIGLLKLVLPRKEMFVGESVTAQLHLYLHSRVQGASGFQTTAFPADGVNVGKLVELEGQRRRVQVGNSLYTVVPFAMVLKPLKPGPITLGPVTASITVELPSARGGGDPFFEQFGFRTPFGFGGSEQRQIGLATDAEGITVLPLPGTPPAGFNGAVGSYGMTVSVGPTNVAVGDPITVRVQLAGRGALDLLTLPEQPAWKSFKVYPPTSKVDTKDPLGLQGSKTFEQVVAPETADIKELPAVTFSFFDPEQRQFRTLQHPPVPLVVRPASSTPAPVALAALRGVQDSSPAQDIVPNKQRLGAVARAAPPLAHQAWFIALQGVPALALISAVMWRRRVDALARNPRLRRQKQVAQILREGLGHLRQQAAANDSEAFFATLFRLLQEQIGERLDVPASAITEAVIEERLRPIGAPGETLAGLSDLFHVCNMARYAPVQTSRELAALIPKVEGVLQQLKELKT